MVAGAIVIALAFVVGFCFGRILGHLLTYLVVRGAHKTATGKPPFKPEDFPRYPAPSGRAGPATEED